MVTSVSDHLNDVAKHCEENSPSDGISWHDKLANSQLPSLFIDGLKMSDDFAPYRGFIISRVISKCFNFNS